MTTIAVNKQDYLSKNALDIPELSHAEAGELATTEVERLSSLINSLSGDDWEQATDCTEWNVRDIVSHLAGAVASLSSWSEFKRQNMGNPYMKEADMKIDAINRRQVEDRAGATDEEVVAEFIDKAPQAVRTRQRLPWLLRQLRLPLGAPLGFASVGYLMNTIYTRDQWMHRHDIAQATGREMVLSPEHDGRIVALVMRDLVRKLKGQLQERTVDLILTGEAGGKYAFGAESQVAATIEVDALAFSRLASGRLAPEILLGQATVEGDRQIATWFLSNAEVPY